MTKDLCRWARNEFVLSDTDKDGVSVRDYLRQLEKSGQEQKELHEPPPHPLVFHIWFYYREISSMRGGGGFGVSPLMPSIINEWQVMRNIELEPIEIDMIIACEREYLRFANDKLGET